MSKNIPRPYRSPWVYAAVWRAGDAYAGRRWAVFNISHNLYVTEYATEAEAKADMRERKRFHIDAMRAARRAAKSNARAIKLLDEKKAAKYIEDKKKLKYFKEIPFPA